MLKNRELWLTAIIAFIAGILAGMMIGDYRSRGDDSSLPEASGVVETVVPDNKLVMLQQLLAKEPDNFSALVQLAHAHFDANRPMEAVQAYTRALKLRPDDADLLTDQGVMFRRLGWYDQAVNNFIRAAAIDPHHEHSLYNLGIVYCYDLNQPQKAIEAWQRYLQRVPQGESAENIRNEIEQLKKLQQ